jgi:hypothetical protein
VHQVLVSERAAGELLMDQLLQPTKAYASLHVHLANALVVLQRHAVSSLLDCTDLFVAVAMSILWIEVARVLDRMETLLVADKEIHTFTHFVAPRWNQGFLAVGQHLNFAIIFNQLASRGLVHLVGRISEVNVQVALVLANSRGNCFVDIKQVRVALDKFG